METLKTLDSLNLEKGALIAHRYEVCERIGTGGMGQVFRVVDRELNDEVVALKLLHPHLAEDQNVFRRFRNEVSVARALSHPNIVRTHDIGRAEEGFMYISMEFVDGESLKDKLAESNSAKDIADRLSFEDEVGILIQILSGVAYAHGKGVIHRDLKPANVLLSRSGEVKLADFGTARILGMDTSITRTGQVIGTPDYMSPEQIRGANLDQSCDIYSLGMIAYELVTGQKPFPADSAVAVAFKHLNDPLPSFAESGKDIPQWYEDATRKAAAKNKEDRFPSAAQFAGAIFEQMPELAVQTGLFSIEGTNFFKTGSQGVSAKLPEAVAAGSAPPSQKALSGGNGSPLPIDDTEFKLGDAASLATDSWQLGTVGGGQESGQAVSPEARSRQEAPKNLSARKTTASVVRAMGVLGAVLICLGVLAVFAVRSHQGLNSRMVGVVDSWIGLSGPQGSLLVRVFNLDTSSRTYIATGKVSGESPTGEDVRDGLSQELEKFVSVEKTSSAKETSSASTDQKLQLVAKNEEKIAAGESGLADWRTGALPVGEEKTAKTDKQSSSTAPSSASAGSQQRKPAGLSVGDTKGSGELEPQKTTAKNEPKVAAVAENKSAAKVVPEKKSEVAVVDETGSSSVAQGKQTGNDQSTQVARVADPVSQETGWKDSSKDGEMTSSSAAAKEEPEKLPVNVKPIDVSLTIRRGSEVLSDPSVSVDGLGRVSWIASVSNLEGNVDDLSESNLRKVFHLNIFDEESAKVVARIKPGKIAQGVGADRTARVSGTFSGLKRVNPETGKYRVDLVLDGEVVAYHPLSLYKARVSFGLTRGSRQAAGGSSISIVRGPSVVDPKEKESVSKGRVPEPSKVSRARESTESVAVEQTEPLPTPLPGKPSESDLPVADRRVTVDSTGGTLMPSRSSSARPYVPDSSTRVNVSPSLGGLPPARMPASSNPPVSSAGLPGVRSSGVDQSAGGETQYRSVDTADLPGVPSSVLAVPERYQGTFSFSPSSAASAERRQMILNLSFQGSAISGQGTINGFEPFVVKGSMYPRGLEIQLQNQSYWIRLTGVRRNQTLRGRYFFPAQNKRGSWEVSRSNY
jgi:serine/threonine protein kinase